MSLFKKLLTMSESAVLGFLKRNEDVPYSIRTISNRLKIKKRCVFAICSNSNCIQSVDPISCGSGRSSSSIFVFSPTKKWKVEKSMISVV